MTINTYQFILDNLTSSNNIVMASKLYVEHQLSLPEEYRVCHENEDQLLENIEQFNIQTRKYATAIKELQENRKLFTSDKPD